MLYVFKQRKQQIDYVTVLYVFKQRKQQIDYVTVLTAIRALRQTIHPRSIMCNFEIGFHNAARQVFDNNVVIVGCLFHLGQYVYNKVLRLGLSEQHMQVEVD